nr:unnamed protein product [Naegleria fowleri]
MSAEDHPRKSSSGGEAEISSIGSSHSINVTSADSSKSKHTQQPSIVVDCPTEACMSANNDPQDVRQSTSSSNAEIKQSINNTHIIPSLHSTSHSEPSPILEPHPNVSSYLETPTHRRNPVSVLRSARGNFGSTSSIMATRGGKSVASQIGTRKSTDVISHNTSEPILTTNNTSNIEVYDNISLLSKYAQSHLGGITTAEAKQ